MPKTNGMTMPMRASASVSAKPMNMVGADQAGRLGLTGEGLDAVAEDDADADAGADRGEAVTDGAEWSRTTPAASA